MCNQPEQPLSNFERDAMLGWLLRRAADVSHEHLDLLCRAAEHWSSEDAAERVMSLRLIGREGTNAGDPAA